MLGKFLLPFKTSIALKANNAIRVSEGYLNAKKIGVIFSYNGEEHREIINKFLDRIEQEGKEVYQIAYVSNAKKDEEFSFPNFTDRNMDFFGSIKNDHLDQFEKTSFDYLLNLDIQSNSIVEYVLANSKAKCRVGKYKENKHIFYELMIDWKEENYEEFLVQVYHYIKNVRNG